MNEHAPTMTPVSANPFVYVFSAVAIGVVLLYLGFVAIDRTGLAVQTTVATVTGKQFTASGETYHTNIAGGRAWVQSQETPETYAVTLNLDGEPTVGLVTPQMFESLNAGETVHVRIQRTRITGRLEVVEVMK